MPAATIRRLIILAVEGKLEGLRVNTVLGKFEGNLWLLRQDSESKLTQPLRLLVSLHYCLQIVKYG